MGTKLTLEEAIYRCRKVHGDKYDYSEMVYKGAHEKIKIICSKHGEFWQRYDVHVLRGGVCQRCNIEVRSKENTLSQKEALVKCFDVHKNTYNYDNFIYNGYEDLINIKCLNHGLFQLKYSNHVKGRGCPVCAIQKHKRVSESRKLTQEEALQRCINAHGKKYNYSNVIYKGYDTKIEIICPKHGSFWQQWNNHVSGTNCPCCALENLPGGYNNKYFKQNPELKNIPAIYYTHKLSNSVESFIKRGITVKESSKNRAKKFPYDVEIINEEHMTLYEAFCKERDNEEKYNYLKYKPKIHFGGYTECFTLEILKELK